MDSGVGTARWKISGKQPILLTIVYKNNFIATGNISVVRKKYFHLNLDQDTYDMIIDKDECKFSVHGTIKGFAAFSVLQMEVSQDRIAEMMIEEIMLTVGE